MNNKKTIIVDNLTVNGPMALYQETLQIILLFPEKTLLRLYLFQNNFFSHIE